MSDLEQKIVAAGADKAPRLTPDYIKSLIKSEVFFTAAEGIAGANQNSDSPDTNQETLESHKLVTICVLTLENGFTLIGHSACASRYHICIR